MSTPNVNVPVNDTLKDRDITQKAQLYGIYQAFALGKAPSNKQIDVAMNSALSSKALSNPSKKLSQEGRELIGDLRNVIEKAKVLFLTKNEGNLLQDFAWQCQQIDAGAISTPNAPVGKDTAKQHGNEALDGLRTLGTLLITNGQFRKLLDDAIVLARDIAGDGASKLADKVNPDDERLAQIDEPAEDNVFHPEPDFKGLKDQVKAKAQSAKAQTQGTLQSAKNNAQSQPTNEDAAGAVKDQLSANVDDDTQEKAKAQATKTKEKTKDYLKEKMPKERREQTIWRLKKMIVEIQGHEDYQRAIDTLLRLAETYTGHTKAVAGDSKGTVQDALDQSRPALTDLKILIERFANSTSMDDLLDSFNQIYSDADRDPELKSWFRSLDTFVRKCLKEQGYVLKDESTDEWNRIYDKGNFLLRERYRNHTDRILDETKFMADQFDKDPQNKAFAESMNKLFLDLGTDDNGKATFKPHLLRDLRDVIIPEIIDSIRYIPVPDIEFTSTDADVVIRDLVLEGDNIIPNIIDLNSDNHFRFGRKNVKSSNKNKIQIHVSGIQTHLTNIRFYAKSKTGLSMRNWGLMDVVLADTGLDFLIKLETADASDNAHFFKVTDVDVKIKNFKLSFRQQHHPILTKIASLFARGPVLQTPIKKVLESQIKKAVSDLDAFCYSIHRDVQRAQAQAKNDPENATNIFSQYFNAYKEKMLAQKDDKKAKAEKAKRKAEEKQVETNIAFTRDQRISNKWNNGAGIPIDAQEKDPKSGSGRFTHKTQEFKDLAYSGSKWESPVFSLGGASQSSTLPKPSEISRKPHETAPSEIRGPKNLESGGAGSSSLFTPADTAATRSATGTGTGTSTGATTGTGVGGGSSNYSSAPFSQIPSTLESTTKTGLNGTSATNGTVNNNHTTLGLSNPVLTGKV